MATTTVVQSPASISEFSDPHSTFPPPPLLQDDPEGAAAARQRLAPKSRLSQLFAKTKLSKSTSAPSLKRTRDPSVSDEHPTPEEPPLSAQSIDVAAPINLDNTALIGEDIYQDRYEWAIVYENQRGMTVFSIPYYSSLSLLPSDPSPFTLPNAPTKRSKQPPVSLETYPLPDGNWHWVSRCWMIDMRTDAGEVQHDGFEYNWVFRQHNWRARVGHFNAGGWVRRRRWVRLMVRPAKPRKEGHEIGTPSTGSSSLGSTAHKPNRQSISSSFPPSVLTGSTDINDHFAQIDPDEVWLGDAETDWQRCRNLMRRFSRDGRKLELWRLWLGFYHPEHKEKFLSPDPKGKRRDKQWTEDEGPLPSEVTAADILSKETVSIAPRDHVIAVLRTHGQHMLQLFMFPESRAQFLKLLGQAGLLPELNIGLSIGFGSSEIEFWSYASDLGDAPGSREHFRTKTKDGNGSPSMLSLATV